MEIVRSTTLPTPVFSTRTRHDWKFKFRRPVLTNSMAQAASCLHRSLELESSGFLAGHSITQPLHPMPICGVNQANRLQPATVLARNSLEKISLRSLVVLKFFFFFKSLLTRLSSMRQDKRAKREN